MPNIPFKLLVLRTHRLEQLREFYECIGLELSEEQSAPGKPRYFSGRAGDVILELHPTPEGATPTDASIRLGFGVADVDTVVEKVRALGLPLIRHLNDTPWGYAAVVRDPDGRAVELYDE